MNAALSPEQYDELLAEQFAHQDYLSEAFGAEARLLDAQARDEWEEDQRLALEEERRFIGPKLPIGYASPIGPNPQDDVPF